MAGSISHSTNFRDGVDGFFSVEEVMAVLRSYGAPDTLAHIMTCNDQSLVVSNKDNGVLVKKIAGKYMPAKSKK